MAASDLDVFPFSVRRWSAELASVQSITANPFTGKSRVTDWGSQYLILAVELPPMDEDNGPGLSAWLAARNGVTGTFRVRVPHWLRTKRNPGALLVDGDGQSGGSLVVGGGKVSMSAALKAGHWVSVNDRLYMVTADADTDEEGGATLSLFPRVSSGDIADGDSVEWSDPSGVFRLAAPSVEFSWNVDNMLDPVSLGFVEVR